MLELKKFLKKESLCYGTKYIIKAYMKDPRFRVNFWLRVGQYLNNKYSNYFIKHLILRIIKNRLQLLYGFDTTFNVKIGIGLRIVHLGCIVIHGNAVIGSNCTIQNSVSIGQGERHDPTSIPKLGDNIFIGVGAKLIGSITIEDNCIIGAMTLVNKSFPSNSTIIGIPGRLNIKVLV